MARTHNLRQPVSVQYRATCKCAGAFRDAGGQPLVVDGAYIRQWIHMRYKACNFKRYMSESDMSVSPSCPVGLLWKGGGVNLHAQGRAHHC